MRASPLGVMPSPLIAISGPAVTYV